MIWFTYGLVLTTFYHIPSSTVGLYIILFAIGNILGPLTIGRLFDTIGRRQMISFTYIFSSVLLAITGWIFLQGVLNAVTQTICWSIIFFFASAGASSAYLTVSEVFPLEVRALAIALFFAIGQGASSLAPLLFGVLIQSGRPIEVFYGNLFGAALMAAAVAQVTQASQNMAREYLDSTLRQFSSGQREADGSNLVLTRSVVINDDIAQGIISVAENGGGAGGEEVFGGCEVIVMTTHGYSGRQHWVGSVTEHVLDTSRVPLLIVQPG